MQENIKRDLIWFGAKRFFEVEAAIKPSLVRGIGVNVLMAVAHRESNFFQVESKNPLPLDDPKYDPNYAPDKGVFQINSKWHAEWLEGLPGCPVADVRDRPTWAKSFVPDWSHSALEPGYVPPLAQAARFAYEKLYYAHEEAQRLGLRAGSGEAIRFALAAYNGGIGGATKGLNEGDVDKYTTGKDYSKDVLNVRWKFGTSLVATELGWF